MLFSNEYLDHSCKLAHETALRLSAITASAAASPTNGTEAKCPYYSKIP